jgi:U3 small nucleolar RNA-associated protein MPP10
MTISSPIRNDLADGNDDAEGEDEDGPTFSNADLNALSSDDEEDIEDLGAMNNTNDINYDDFFAPPPRKATKSTRKRALPKPSPPHSQTSKMTLKTFSVQSPLFAAISSTTTSPPMRILNLLLTWTREIPSLANQTTKTTS